MSLFPYVFNDFAVRPSRLLDQHFGLCLDADDLLAPLTVNSDLLRRPYYRQWRAPSAGNDAGSIVNMNSDKFQVNLDVQQFSPNEITVKVSGKNTITVEGKHEEKQDEHGFVSRHFVRRYVLPDGHDIDKVVSNLSSDGVLSISAPRTSETAAGDRSIPVVQTGIPSKIAPKDQKEIKDGENEANGA